MQILYKGTFVPQGPPPNNFPIVYIMHAFEPWEAYIHNAFHIHNAWHFIAVLFPHDIQL